MRQSVPFTFLKVDGETYEVAGELNVSRIHKKELEFKKSSF